MHGDQAWAGFGRARTQLPDKSFELPVMGTFEVSGGKISAWRDYFDMNPVHEPDGIRLGPLEEEAT